MVRYILYNKLTSVQEGDALPEGAGLVTVLTSSEYEELFHETGHYRMMKQGIANIQYCKADMMGDFISGSFSCPSREALTGERSAFAFFIERTELVFIDDQGFSTSVLEQMKEIPLSHPTSVLRFFAAFLEYLIKDDVFFLQHFEENLTSLEEQLLDKNDASFNRQIFQIRRKLAVLGSYYEQLQDMGETFASDGFCAEDEKNSLLFGLFADRAGRLYSNVQMLKEYSMQLREMHQTQVDMHQNQIMKFLTIVTTIFMPLTLIAGWYGMNFVNMPELDSPYGYILVCVISLLIVLVEVWLFKIKNWFD